MNYGKLYSKRFVEESQEWKKQIWALLWEKIFSKYVKPDDAVLDVGAGYCEFINAAKAKRRFAVDLNPDASKKAGAGIEVHITPANQLSFLSNGAVNVVFSSNFLEHLPNKETLSQVLAEIHRVLAENGTLILMGPNIRFLPDLYWDFYDHLIPLSDRSVVEALEVHGFEPFVIMPKFLPYTAARTRTPRWIWPVRLYLSMMPLSSMFFGKQFLIVARKGSEVGLGAIPGVGMGEQ